MSSGPPTVLIVDDDPLALRAAKRVLEASGFQVETSDSPIGVSILIRKHKPALIVLDFNMPAMDGQRLAQVLGQLPEVQDLPIIFHSGMDEALLYEATKHVPHSTFVSKGDGPTALVAAAVRSLKMSNPHASGAFRLDLPKKDSDQ
ncbi:MAG: response regulator [Myxococcales bacterium]|nr:response regulator [Myxococcales bacterium]MCB9580494.1 response regulator [Polyangiaceae bacterium]